MTVSLIGNVLTAMEVNDGWSSTTGGSLSEEADIIIQGAGSLSEKVNNATELFYNNNATWITGVPYDVAAGDVYEDYGFVVWCNSTTPISTLQLLAGSGGTANTGVWNVVPDNYTGGFLPKVATFKRPVDAGSAMNGYIDTFGFVVGSTVSIMGNIETAFFDQITVFRGLRTDGTGNDFETIRSADQDTNIYGIVTALAGSFILKGGIFLGPETGDATSSFSDTAAVAVWGDEPVHSGFYDIDIRGTGTTVDFDACLIRQEDSGNTYTRWNISIDGTNEGNEPVFTDTNSIFDGFDTLTLRSTSSLNGTKLDNGNRVTQNSGLISECDIVNANRGDGESFILSDYPSRIQNCSFTQSSGHAIEFTTLASGKSITFTGNSFTGYDGANGTNDTASSGPTNAAIYNNSFGDVTLNIVDGEGILSVRNGPGATTTVVQAVTLTLGGIIANADAGKSSEVRIYTAGTTTELDGSDGIAVTGDGTVSFTFSFQQGDPPVDIRIFNVSYQPVNLLNFTLPASNTTIPIQQIFDRNYEEGLTPFP